MSTATATVVTISVTQENIDEGERNVCSDCPVALAIMAAVPGALGVTVRFETATVSLDGHRRLLLSLPREATEFIESYDDGADVSPFTFTAEARP